ncbi:tannase/feruloyl esterase family alpha/beta hydrolase [Pseudomonas viridiflava]|uniref:tannase/feruloyl esterase family alpha/beta hydrolase n=1 Tax=Pseudomonas viridiflava TaxID=33069 RepID=UPI000F0113FF|nr:tannase/feruloyl esterase family alpha/beta hydrolase [Pseudomonas viridiflava]MEE4079659.1 tannase/feruloyl esterase family alpha/beta hydrolase [Pseudomonas viridiflava]MEE4099471.1 tannase/feruloyl esterase family alpha/beta hydrolase [Pseudomonas viridiflava]MEE4124949.1 tannase/feruloyl esterase family alpha/beta hydrolase [Pseudomonas viridiflava]MEE4224994.1 tannase/feruloyl esterase family alpha/beta hydrolase [Pseudomonas viridiflava]QVI88187.1 tannase/feruloyl esterase family alph
MKPTMPSRSSVFALLVISFFPLTPALAGTPSSNVADNLAQLPVVTPVTACAALTQTDLSDIGGSGSRVVSASESSRDGVAVCAVEGLLAPQIGFKLELPTTTWAQRYLQVGCGGFCGHSDSRPGVADSCKPLKTGAFAVASTDMGHKTIDTTFGDDPQKRADFAHRGVHLTALASKKLIQTFYGRKAEYAYFTGCSDGGREALIEAQRYPEDFNGIIAGAAALNFQVQKVLFHGWVARANTGPDGKPIILASRLPILHKAVLAQCDVLDGQIDGLISDPRLCRFDPSVVQCKVSADNAKCLTAPEVEAARRIYDGPKDPASGERLIVGGPQPGSELAWAGLFVPVSADQPIVSQQIAEQSIRSLVFETNPPEDFKLADLRFDKSTFERLRPLHALYDATNPDLAPFASRGGKLILWHGWADPQVSPLNTLAYHEAVEAHMGKARTESFTRLYMLPGVYHCGRGEGPSEVDLLTPIMAWVEKGQAPGAIVARQYQPKPVDKVVAASLPAFMTREDISNRGRTRKVFPYPYMAEYDHKGYSKRANSYQRSEPLTAEKTPKWVGSGFFQPYEPLQH